MTSWVFDWHLKLRVDWGIESLTYRVCFWNCVLLSNVWLFETPWTVAHQAPFSMGFSRQEYWSDSHSLLQEISLTQGPNLGLLHCRHILYCLSHQGICFYLWENSVRIELSGILGHSAGFCWYEACAHTWKLGPGTKFMVGKWKWKSLSCVWLSLARMLEWVGIPFSRGSSQPRDWT